MSIFRDENGLTPLGWAGIAVGLLWAAILTLWLGTAPWTDDAFWVLFGFSGATGVMSGVTWADRQLEGGAGG